MIQSLLPTTVIDIDRWIVKQTHPYHIHTVLRREFMNLAVKRLISDDSDKRLWSSRYGLFSPVREVSTFVTDMLEEAWKLPPDLREGHLIHSMRMLTRKAMVVIKYVQSKLYVLVLASSSSSSESADSNVRHHSEPGEVLQTSVIKKLRQDLEISSDPDFDVLLAVAVKHAPGTFKAVAGDPAIIEEVFLELFESF